MEFLKKKRSVVLVLGGGSARGLAHIGVLKVLEREKIPIDAVVGTSMGALIGAAYSVGVSLKKMEDIAHKFNWKTIFDPTIPRMGLLAGKKLEHIVTQLTEGKGFADWTEQAGFAAAGTGWWTSIAAADFNGDGLPDYVVGNVGLNTQYHADPQHPALLFSGDFRGDGSTQLIEGYYEGDRLYPWRSRKGLAAAVPSILKRFPRNEYYARATLGGILGEEKLAAARRFAATEFRSGVFLSQPDGTYRFEPLPRIAQISPLQGLVAGDFDGDGHADIYAVQNSYAPIPSVGRFDGGLSQLLRGDGRGHFTPVPVAESGLLVPGDAKALAVLDLDQDGWPDFLVSRNNNTTLAFRNNGVAGRHSLRILLRGPAGNPTAVGARITVELTDGSSQTSEVYAGSGYYSQSTAACFFGYPDANPPKNIRVRWPSGVTTEHGFPPDSSTLTLSAPAP